MKVLVQKYDEFERFNRYLRDCESGFRQKFGFQKFDKYNRVITISLDSKYRPFLGESNGSNRHEHERYYMGAEPTGILNELIKAYKLAREKESSIPGGRLFMDEEGAYFKSKDLKKNYFAKMIAV